MSLLTPPSFNLRPRDNDNLPILDIGPAYDDYPRKKPTRKTTHSQIEKRRREKINHTMERLKRLVPACSVPSLRKLDVLVATADYIEELLKNRSQFDAAASLIAIAESPVIQPNRMAISELL